MRKVNKAALHELGRFVSERRVERPFFLLGNQEGRKRHGLSDLSTGAVAAEPEDGGDLGGTVDFLGGVEKELEIAAAENVVGAYGAGAAKSAAAQSRRAGGAINAVRGEHRLARAEHLKAVGGVARGDLQGITGSKVREVEDLVWVNCAEELLEVLFGAGLRGTLRERFGFPRCTGDARIELERPALPVKLEAHRVFHSKASYHDTKGLAITEFAAHVVGMITRQRRWIFGGEVIVLGHESSFMVLRGNGFVFGRMRKEPKSAAGEFIGS